MDVFNFIIPPAKPSKSSKKSTTESSKREPDSGDAVGKDYTPDKQSDAKSSELGPHCGDAVGKDSTPGKQSDAKAFEPKVDCGDAVEQSSKSGKQSEAKSSEPGHDCGDAMRKGPTTAKQSNAKSFEPKPDCGNAIGKRTIGPSIARPRRLWKTQNISFLDFPAEIQNMIFAFLFEETKDLFASLSRSKDCYSWRQSSFKDQGAHGKRLWDVISLSQTCSAIRQAVLPMFLAGSRIHVNFDKLEPRKGLTQESGSGCFPCLNTEKDLGAFYTSLARAERALQPELMACLSNAGDACTANIRDLSFNLFYQIMPPSWESWESIMWRVTVSDRRSVKVKRLDEFHSYLAVKGWRPGRSAMKLQTMLRKMLAKSQTGYIGLKELEAIRAMLAELYPARVVESL